MGLSHQAGRSSGGLAAEFGVEDGAAPFRKAKKALADKIIVCADSRWSGRALNRAPLHRVPAAREGGGQRKRLADV